MIGIHPRRLPSARFDTLYILSKKVHHEVVEREVATYAGGYREQGRPPQRQAPANGNLCHPTPKLCIGRDELEE
jgi:hypothetical protein